MIFISLWINYFNCRASSLWAVRKADLSCFPPSISTECFSYLRFSQIVENPQSLVIWSTGPLSTLLISGLWTASAAVGPSESQLFAMWNPDLQSRQILWWPFHLRSTQISVLLLLSKVQAPLSSLASPQSTGLSLSGGTLPMLKPYSS